MESAELFLIFILKHSPWNPPFPFISSLIIFLRKALLIATVSFFAETLNTKKNKSKLVNTDLIKGLLIKQT
jgi:hypothetical protein